MKTVKIIPTAAVIFIVLLLSSNNFLTFVQGGCRDQERVECESVCHWNASSNQHVCNLRAVLILPSNLTYEASLTKVLPVFELAEQKIRQDEILPRYVHLNWTTYDDNCESSLATISAVNGFTSDCAHVQFGPICDYSLAPVSRIVKYFRHDGTPLITIGGYTFDFIQNKTTCANEYHMLIRAGLLSFQSIADFMVAIMNKYEWKHALLYYERDGQYNVAGEHTCHLLMQTIAKLFRSLNLSFSSFPTDAGGAGGANVTETLRKKVGVHESKRPGSSKSSKKWIFGDVFSESMFGKKMCHFHYISLQSYKSNENQAFFDSLKTSPKNHFLIDFEDPGRSGKLNSIVTSFLRSVSLCS